MLEATAALPAQRQVWKPSVYASHVPESQTRQWEGERGDRFGRTAKHDAAALERLTARGIMTPAMAPASRATVSAKR